MGKYVTKFLTSFQNTSAPIITLILFFVALEVFVRVGDISRLILPPPSATFMVTIERFIPDIWPHFLFTLRVITVGFLIAIPLGMLIASVFSQYDILTKAITPYVIVLVVTPMITLVPLLMLWLGYDPKLRIIVVVIQAAPIIALNTLTGFTNIESSKLDLAKSIGASKFQTFTKVIFPNAMPQVFAGIKLGVIFSTIGAVSADFIAGTFGLGFRIIQFSKFFMMELVYGSIVALCAISITLFLIVTFIESRVIVWRKS